MEKHSQYIARRDVFLDKTFGGGQNMTRSNFEQAISQGTLEKTNRGKKLEFLGVDIFKNTDANNDGFISRFEFLKGDNVRFK